MRGFSGRGTGQSRVLDLLDGEPLNDGYTGILTWQTLQVAKQLGQGLSIESRPGAGEFDELGSRCSPEVWWEVPTSTIPSGT